MLQHCYLFLTFLNVCTLVLSKNDDFKNDVNALNPKMFAIWKNGVIPFYVNPEHFDHEQTQAILSSLALFQFRTCLKFKPVMSPPGPADEVMEFVNPDGTKRCIFDTKGHSVYNTHIVKLGYECLKSPQVDMMIMRALGFPFEHNRDNRDLYIDVLEENIEPGNIELFTKEDVLPLELRFIPYDVNSVMHFGNRDFSKNGHRTIIFKDPSVKQNRIGLNDLDIQKIEIIYGSECRSRDRQEKIELCQSYPGVARKKRQLFTIDDLVEENLPTKRKKREVDNEKIASKSLRINPDITPPPNQSDDVTKNLKELGIDEAVQEIVEQVYKVSSLALKNARVKYCNYTNNTFPDRVKTGREGEIFEARNSSDILGIIEVVADFAKGMVENAIQNLTKFCENSEGLEVYQRYSCASGAPDPRCRQSYKSTKSGPVVYSTQHRPVMKFSTGHDGGHKIRNVYQRAGNFTEDNIETTTQSIRRRRNVEVTTEQSEHKEHLQQNIADNKTIEGEQMKTTDRVEQSENKEVNVDTVSQNKEKVEENKAKVAENQDQENENKGKPIKDNKEKIAEAETDDIKAKSEEKMKINNKENLRMGTMLPGYTDRRRSQRYNRDGSESDLDNLDTILAKKIIQKKHIIQKKNRKEKSRLKGSDEDELPLKIKEKRKQLDKKSYMAIPAESYVKNADSDTVGNVFKFDSDRDGIGVNVDEQKETKEEEPPVVAIEEGNSEADDNNMKPTINVGEIPMIRPAIRPKKLMKKGRQGRPSNLPRTVALSKKNKEFYNERRWPGGKLFYMIQPDTTYDLSDMRRRLREVSAILEEKTCVRMKEIKPTEANKFEDYIVIDSSPDYITGRVGGKQRFGSIELFRGGQHRQHAAMMVMAMLGFYFEVSRHDREKYIRVHMRHVRPDKLHHFEMIRSDATLPLPYDYASATHPAWQFWRQVGRTGISTVATYKEKDPDGSIMKLLGQNEQILSDLDIVKINSVYGVDCFRKQRSKVSKTRKSGEKNETLYVPSHEVEN